ncbi:redoxin domain-containing protein [Herbaspirillum sp. GCM10030257]|uniref:redoxin domain-containing protein n=1 Tax=Herbaspirillum sp. GCM10030257 TaxID=3273393 RepID=UPI003612127E
MHNFSLYPELDVLEWINTAQPIRLADLRGRVVVLHAFQMLCPGCVSYGIPQAERIARTFPSKEVIVLGLHTVFEHHDVMTPAALRAFASEYRIRMPIAIDRPAETGSVPTTMRLLQLQGTPSLVLLDKTGRIRHQHLGEVEDLRVGAEIGALLMETAQSEHPVGSDIKTGASPARGCDGDTCRVDPSMPGLERRYSSDAP